MNEKNDKIMFSKTEYMKEYLRLFSDGGIYQLCEKKKNIFETRLRTTYFKTYIIFILHVSVMEMGF